MLPGKYLNYNITTKVLPVDTTCFKEIEEDIQKYDCILSLGLAANRKIYTIEQIGINIDDFRIPSNSGENKQHAIIHEDGLDGYFSTLPIDSIIQHLQYKNIEMKISYSAGTYICNHLLYELGYHLHDTKQKYGFIHVPLFLIEGIINLAGYYAIRYGVGQGLKKYIEPGDQASCYLIWYGMTRVLMEPMRDQQFNMGTKGYWSSEDFAIRDLQGNIIWQFDQEAASAEFQQHDPYTLEHVDWVNHIRRGTAHDEATGTAESSLAGTMGREAAYTGLVIDWDAFSAADMCLLPENLELGSMDMSKFIVHHPGK